MQRNKEHQALSCQGLVFPGEEKTCWLQVIVFYSLHRHPPPEKSTQAWNLLHPRHAISPQRRRLPR